MVPMPYSPLSTVSHAERRAHSYNSHVERMFPWVRVLRRTIRDDHLSEGEAIENRPYIPVVVVSDSRKRNSLSMVERCYLRESPCPMVRLFLDLPMCIFHFCHSNSWPSILKLTPSGCTTWSGFKSSLTLKLSPGFSAMRSGRKSHASRGGGTRSRLDAANESSSNGGGTVVGAESSSSSPLLVKNELGDAFGRYRGGKSI